MKLKLITSVFFFLTTLKLISQAYPVFGPEVKVKITGLSFDAMEPFISLDGNTLFFNSLNSGGNTNLYYATKVNDSTFNYVGLVAGTYDPTPNHLDAVPSLDSTNNFFWTSTRDYPAKMDNLHRGVYNAGTVSNITRVYGDFNIHIINYPLGWLIMDAAISYHGNLLYYTNAQFDFSSTSCVGIPCEAKLGVAQKINDSTFNKLPTSNAIFNNVNDTVNYIIYAPQVTMDGLELYYSRLLKGSFNTEVCVSVRTSTSASFSLPAVIHSNPGFVPEAPTPTTDKQKIYYHQKDTSGLFHIYLRYRTIITDVDEVKRSTSFTLFPNPAGDFLILEGYEGYGVKIIDVIGNTIMTFQVVQSEEQVDVSVLSKGIYLLESQTGERRKFVKE